MGVLKTGILMAAMTALFMGAGYLLAGQSGIVLAFVVAAAMNVFAYWNSDKMALKAHNARQVDARSAPELVAMVEDLARRAELPMPRVYLIDSDQPNAFATGRNPQNAAVAATTGLLRALSHDEIAGVMAHELAHVKNRDTMLMTITATFAGAITMLANFAFFFRGGRDNPLGIIGVIGTMILAPIAAALVQMAISRTREYEADRIGAEICGQPMALASALAKIAGLAQRVDNMPAERNPAMAHMFIINPLHAFSRDKLFSTHPATENRIAALRELAAGMGAAASRPAASRQPGPSSIPRTGASRRRDRDGPWG